MTKASRFDFNLFRSIEVFAAVAETRHVTQAAQMLGISQSAASQHIKNLETSLGAQLFDRGQRPIELTKAGIALLRRATAILGEVDALRAEVRRINAAPFPLLRVAILASIATTLAPTLARLARVDFKIPELSMYAGISTEHPGLLRARRADLAITTEHLFEIEGLVRYPMLSEQFLLVTPKGYDGPLDDLPALARDLPFVRFSRETGLGRRIDQHLSRVRMDLPRSLEGDRSSVVLAPVSIGDGFTIMTPTLLIDGLKEGMALDIHRLPIAGFARDIMVVAREQDLGELPEIFATHCAASLKAAIDRQMPRLPKGTLKMAQG